jgi:hypothetical protein
VAESEIPDKDRSDQVASQAFRPDTAPAEYTNWILTPHLVEASTNRPPTLAGEVSIWPLTNFSKKVS